MHKNNIIFFLKEILIERLGPNSVPFAIEIDKKIPASVQLLPAKRYTGSPIGTSYDLRVYAVSNSDVTDEKFQRRYMVRLGVRLVHYHQINLIETELFSKRDSADVNLPRLRMKLLSPKVENIENINFLKFFNLKDFYFILKARKLIKQTSLILQRANNSFKSSTSQTEQTSPNIAVGTLKVSKRGLFMYKI